MKKRTAAFRFSLVPALILLFSQAALTADNPGLFSEPGVIDLTRADFSENPIVSLAGPWLFSPGNDRTEQLEIAVPGSWAKAGLSEQGWGVYTLDILLPPGNHDFSLRFGNIYSSAEIRINGNTAKTFGVVGTGKSSNIPQWSPSLITLENQSEMIRLEVVSGNYTHARGGIANQVDIGVPAAMRFHWELSRLVEILFMGIVLWMGIYHLLFAFLRRESAAESFSFALACLFFAVRMIFVGNFQISQFFSPRVWGPFLRVEYLLYILSTYFFVRFLALLYPREYPRRVVTLYLAVTLLYGGIVLASPTLFFTSLLPVHQILLIINFLLAVIFLIRAVKEKRDGSGLILAGMIIVLLSGLNDVLMYKVQTIFTNLSILGSVLFMFFDSFVLTRGFSRKFDEAEVLSFSLQDANSKLDRSHQEIEKKNRELQLLASSDHLTGLPNRMALFELVDKELSRAGRNGKKVGIILFDLDNFKQINDTYGHDSGDLVLREVSRRLSEGLRKGDTIFRLGGDEFTVIVPDIAESGNLNRVAEKILSLLNHPVEMSGIRCQMSCSLGISQYPEDGDTVNILLKNADIALYEAKNQGRNRFVWFNRHMQEVAENRYKLISRMPDALESGDFTLHFQPQMNMKNYSLYGLEALIRWQDSNLGFLSPADFIPLMEESGFIHTLGDWIMDEVFRISLPWIRENPELLISINISSIQFRSPDFLERLDRKLGATGFPTENLVIELTEGVIMNDSENTFRKLAGIRERGIRISVDDFGTGYSSLSYLKRFPLDHLKIDKTFISDLFKTSFDKDIVATIIDLAGILNLEVVAEGIETVSQQEFLESRGCYILQGYLTGRPAPAEEIDRIVREKEDVREFLQML